MSDRQIIIRSLREYRFSAPKALEVAIDAERKDAEAVAWVNKALNHSYCKAFDKLQNLYNDPD